MLKITILYDDSVYKLTQKVNDFIKNNKVISISYAVAPCGYGYTRECCILYQE